jgi:hypothetical protein
MLKIGSKEYFEHMYMSSDMANHVKTVGRLVEDIQKNRQVPLSRDEVL